MSMVGMQALAMARTRTQRGEPVASLNVLIPAALHERCKLVALQRRVSVTQLVTEVLTAALPPAASSSAEHSKGADQ